MSPLTPMTTPVGGVPGLPVIQGVPGVDGMRNDIDSIPEIAKGDSPMVLAAFGLIPFF